MNGAEPSRSRSGTDRYNTPPLRSPCGVSPPVLRASLRSFRFPGEAMTLAALMFFLPLLEAPKNLAWLAFVLIWVANRIRARDVGGRWDVWDTLILAWIASAYVVAAFAGLHRSEWGGANDVLRYGLVLWLIKRSGYGRAEFRLIVGTLLASALVGFAHGYWVLFVSEMRLARDALQLNSVGHVNHSAIYLAIILGMTLSAVMAYWRAWSRIGRILGLAAIAVMAASVIISASRAAVGIAAILVLLLAAAWLPRMKAALAAVLLVTAIVGALAWVAKIEVVTKQEFLQAGRSGVLNNRSAIWDSAVAAWERFPMFGVGMDNFNLITVDRVREWRAQAGKPYDESSYFHGSHGHSLLFNTLAERGIVGLAALAAVLLAWIGTLVRHRPRAQDEDLKWALWGGALSAWVVSVGTGLVNTSLHHEHAILSVTLLGLWLAYSRGRSSP